MKKIVKIKRQKVFVISILLIFFTSVILICENRAEGHNTRPLDTSLLDQIDIMRIYNITEDLSVWSRITGSFECNLAASYIQSMLNETFNITDSTFEDWIYNETYASNVVARINGTNLKDELIIICAHYDSISTGETAPGANDNAVSVAVCMEVMRIIQNIAPLNRTLLFVSFAGEEQAYIGSQAWVTQHNEELSKVVAVINLDMIGYGKYFTLIKNDQSDWLADTIIAASSIVNVTFTKTISPYPETARFDHDTFWAVQVPCVSLFQGGSIYPYYHTEQDTIDRISFSLVEKCAQATLLSVLYLGTVQFQHNWMNYSILIWALWGVAAIFPFILYKKIK
ncbi:MAG: Zn-dependent exopeptidase M28 [Candidatus Helarchaeota archaeon]|nr:Zn-dependent exopeptidase M28 [Candidatus Helarchaeota archaeon]